ncbi:possible amino acid/polyamine transporter family II, partial [Thalassiosira pseudonana CCMP1335]
GVGMLGLPYVFKSAGWIGGFFVTLENSMVTHVHENVLTRMRKPLNSFPGIAREAFGDNGCICLSAVLYFELFSCLAIFLVSLGDHLHLLFPNVSQSRHMTIVAGLLTVPSALLRTPKLLSYLSMLGTVATVAVVSSVVLSALVMFVVAGEKAESLSDAREYTMYSSTGLSLALGIVAYCFSGHAIVPSIYSSMKRPQEFEKMIDLTYGVVLLCCFLVAVSGYYMFGNDVEDQITLSLEATAGDSASTLMAGLTWLMILTAISKFTLTMFPDLAMEMVDSLVKIILIFSALAVAIFFPSFSFLCSLVGLICTMIVSVIFPALAHLKLFGPNLSASDKVIDWMLVTGGSIVAVVGTIATLQ